jgi:hypothetical protein
VAGNRKALIIANDTYEHEALRNLRAPAADADALGRVLADPEIGDFEVEVVRNQPAHVIQPRIEGLLSTAKRDDVVLIHFSCHGLKDVSGALFFAAANTIPDRLGSTTVPAEFVHRYMQRSPSRAVVLLLDCCFGGAFPLGSTIRAAGNVNVLDSFRHDRPPSGRGNVVITASSSMEFSLEGDHLVDDNQPLPSFFTAALVEGLTSGDADQDEDGWVSVRELYEYVFDKVRERNPNQTPTIQDDLTGKLFISRSRRRLLPGIPPGLRMAMNGDRYARLGAISELQSLLAGDDLPTAEGAYEALTQLTRDDSRTVVDAASEALKGATIEVDHTEVRFGRVERGSVPPHQTIRLLGPPIARVCVAHPSHGWIHVAEQAGGELDIWVDTTGTGALHGTVTLQGPAGQAVVTVEIDLFGPIPRESGSAAPNRQSIADSGPRQQSTARPASQDASIARTTPSSSVGHLHTPADDRPATAGGLAVDRSPSEVTTRAPGPVRPPSTNVRRRPRTRPILAVTGGLIVAAGVAAFIVFGGVIGNPVGEAGTLKAELKNPKYAVNSLAFSRDGKTLAVGSTSSDGNNGCTYLWNLATRTRTSTLADQGSGVAAVAISPDGKTLAVGDDSGGIYLWSLATDKIITNFSNSSSLGISAVLAVEFSPDGKNLAEGDVTLGGNLLTDNVNYVRLWNIEAYASVPRT